MRKLVIKTLILNSYFHWIVLGTVRNKPDMKHRQSGYRGEMSGCFWGR